jgi:hypothetical protein
VVSEILTTVKLTLTTAGNYICKGPWAGVRVARAAVSIPLTIVSVPRIVFRMPPAVVRVLPGTISVH